MNNAFNLRKYLEELNHLITLLNRNLNKRLINSPDLSGQRIRKLFKGH